MIYLRQSRRVFLRDFKTYARGRKVYYQWVDLRCGVGLKDGERLVRDLLDRTIQVLTDRGERVVRGSLKIGFYPGNWIGYRFYTKMFGRNL